jgi:hypothetical protein
VEVVEYILRTWSKSVSPEASNSGGHGVHLEVSWSTSGGHGVHPGDMEYKDI